MEMQIEISSETMPSINLKEYLEPQLSSIHSDVTLELRKAKARLRHVDPTTLVAIVGAVGTGLGALITGLLQIAKQSSANKIIIQSEDGARIEFPADMTSEEIDMLIKKMGKLNAQRIIMP